MLKLAWRHYRRELRSGEIPLLLVATLVAVACCTMIATFTDRLSRTMDYRATELLSADLALSSARPLQQRWLDKAAEQQLAVASVLRFRSMVYGPASDELVMARVRAVSTNYPLRGEIQLSHKVFGEVTQRARQGPEPGTVWADNQLMQRLSLQVGDEVEIGQGRFTVAGVLLDDADRSGTFYDGVPKLLMQQGDIPATGVVQQGSRVSWLTYFAGEGQGLDTFHAWAKAHVLPSQRLRGGKDSSPSVGSALGRAQQYLGLSSLLVIVLAGVAIAMGARRFSQRHFDSCAILRCFGASQRDLMLLYSAQLLFTAVLGALAGVGLGWLAHHGLLYFIAPWLPADLLPARFQPLWVSALLGVVILLGFSLPPLLRLANVPTLRVLRGELAPTPSSGWLLYGSALLLLTLLAYLLSGSWLLSLRLTGALVVLAVILVALCWPLLQLLGRIKLKGLWRQVLAQLYRHRRNNLAQLMAFTFTLMAASLVLVLRTDLISGWQGKLPVDAPNHFVLNLMPEDVQSFGSFLRERQLRSNPLYPIVRGRLTAINGQPVEGAVSKEEQADNALRRELYLTASNELGHDNRVVAGQWWGQQENVSGQVSVESRLAERLGITLGDRLSFMIGAQPLEVQVSSLRNVQWDSFNPNFYMIFPQGALDDFPTTYITSLHLPPQPGLIKTIVKAFPSVTLIEVERMLQQVKDILAQVTLAVEYILLMVLAAALVLLFASIQNSLDERAREAAIYRTLGADSALIKRIQGRELALLGLLAGILALAGVEGLKAVLYHRVFELDYAPSLWLWPLLPLAGFLLLSVFGRLALRPVLKVTPLEVLRRY